MSDDYEFKNPVVIRVKELCIEMDSEVLRRVSAYGDSWSLAEVTELEDYVHLQLERVVMTMEEYRSRPSTMDECLDELPDVLSALSHRGEFEFLRMDIMGIKPGDIDSLYYKSLQNLRRLTRMMREAYVLENGSDRG